jgi:hypothetical protein
VLTATFARADTRLRLAASIWRELHQAGHQLLPARYLAGIPGAQLAETESGHLPMAERPEQWGQLITTFLTRHNLATGHPAGARNRG